MKYLKFITMKIIDKKNVINLIPKYKFNSEKGVCKAKIQKQKVIGSFLYATTQTSNKPITERTNELISIY